LNRRRAGKDTDADREHTVLQRFQTTHIVASQTPTVGIGAFGLFAAAEPCGIVVVNSEERMNAATRRLWTNLMDCRGAGMVEYALLVAFIGIALVAAVTLLGAGLMTSFGSSAQAVADIGAT
jgi:Flp pilus assembly pilin Flp